MNKKILAYFLTISILFTAVNMTVFSNSEGILMSQEDVLYAADDSSAVELNQDDLNSNGVMAVYGLSDSLNLMAAPQQLYASSFKASNGGRSDWTTVGSVPEWSTGAGGRSNVTVPSNFVGFSEKDYSLRVCANSSNVNAAITLDLASKRTPGIYSLQHLRFALAFDAKYIGGGVTANNKEYFQLTDKDGKPFMRVLQSGSSLAAATNKTELITFDSASGKNIAVSIPNGSMVWRWYDIYVNTDSTGQLANKFCLMVDGKPIALPNGDIWLTPSSDAAATGTVSAKTLTDLGSLTIGHINGSEWASVMIGAIKLETYEITSASKVDKVKIENKTNPSMPPVSGAEAAYSASYIGELVISETKTFEYTTDGTSWSAMPLNNIVPNGATQLRLTYTIKDLFGFTDTKTETVDVFQVTKPVLSSISLTSNGGEVLKEGDIITVNYTGVDTNPINTVNIIVEWYRVNDITKEPVKINGVTTAEYKATKADEECLFITAVATPINAYGVTGEALSTSMMPNAKTVLDMFLELINIDTTPAVNTIDLPLKYTESGYSFGVTYSWESSDTSIISINGNVAAIARPSDDKMHYVKLTVTATMGNSDRSSGYSPQKVYTISVPGTKYGSEETKAPSSPSRGGGGGGGGRGTAGVISAPVLDIPKMEFFPVGETNETFSDVSGGDWFNQYVKDLAERNIISTKESFYRPEDNVTRAEFLKMVVICFGIENKTDSVDFADVNSSDWFYSFVNSAYSAGIVNGTSADLFGPNDDITREDMAVILNRALKYVKLSLPSISPSFTDNASLSSYAKDAVGSMQKAGILNGYDDGTFKPRGNATRAETAKIISIALKMFESADIDEIQPAEETDPSSEIDEPSSNLPSVDDSGEFAPGEEIDKPDTSLNRPK